MRILLISLFLVITTSCTNLYPTLNSRYEVRDSKTNELMPNVDLTYMKIKKPYFIVGACYIEAYSSNERGQVCAPSKTPMSAFVEGKELSIDYEKTEESNNTIFIKK